MVYCIDVHIFTVYINNLLGFSLTASVYDPISMNISPGTKKTSRNNIFLDYKKDDIQKLPKTGTNTFHTLLLNVVLLAKVMNPLGSIFRIS